MREAYGAKLTDEETKTVTGYLTNHYGIRPAGKELRRR